MLKNYLCVVLHMKIIKSNDMLNKSNLKSLANRN